MRVLASKSLLSFCILVILSLSSVTMVNADDEGITAAGLTSYLRSKYDDLPEQGKFATGAALGFGGSRIVVKSAASVVKVAGAAFVA
jgi:hypothetical protein